jgi:hypothetical protein
VLPQMWHVLFFLLGNFLFTTFYPYFFNPFWYLLIKRAISSTFPYCSLQFLLSLEDDVVSTTS